MRNLLDNVAGLLENQSILVAKKAENISFFVFAQQTITLILSLVVCLARILFFPRLITSHVEKQVKAIKYVATESDF